MTGELTNHLWQSTLFAGAVGLLAQAFRRNRAEVRYWLWFTASLKFLLPFAVLMTVGSHVEWAPATARATTPIPTLPALPAIAQFSRPFSESSPTAAPAPGRRNRAPAALFGVWALGVAWIVYLRFRGWLRIRSALGASTPMEAAAAVETRSCPGLWEPGVVGVWRPVLLLPAGIGERLTPAQLDAVLEHEMCHVRRRDNLRAFLHMAVETLFWFHPAVWWIGARLLEERERACDEEVLRRGADPRVYAEGVLNVCKLYGKSPLACVSGVTGSNLKKRIEGIMTNRSTLRLNFARKALLGLAGMFALATPITIGMLNAPRVRAQAAPTGTPRFQTVSIQPGCVQQEVGERKSRDGARKSGPPAAPSAGNLTLNCSTVAGIVHAAYGPFASGRPLDEASPLRYLDAVPLSGGPSWMYTDQYQIHARAQGDPGQEMMRGPMMQALLEDRFGLKIRRETRNVPAYALTVADGGPKMRPFVGECVADSILPPLAPGQKRCWEIGGGERKEASFSPHFSPDTVVKDLDGFALWLFIMTDRPVVNRTGLAGKYFLDFVFGPNADTPGALARLAVMARRNGNAGAAPAPSNPAGPSIFTALQEQLGLKLEPITAPRDYLIVENAERPAVN